MDSKLAYIAYKGSNFRSDTMDIIGVAENILHEYLEMGYDLTLRQLYYQFVARHYLPNTEKSYNKLGRIVSDARLAGLLPWNLIVDRTRKPVIPSAWSSPASILRSAARSYQRDLRCSQPENVEVWVEKEALASVLDSVCSVQRVASFSCRGYVSQSAMWRAAQRFIEDGRPGIILYLGDHDPSGIDMTRDVQDRLDMFDACVEVRRIALNWDQIQEYNPPPDPAKVTDSRAPTYIAEFGEYSWELDALPPNVIASLIRDSLADLTDMDLLEEETAREDEERRMLYRIADEHDEE